MDRSIRQNEKLHLLAQVATAGAGSYARQSVDRLIRQNEKVHLLAQVATAGGGSGRDLLIGGTGSDELMAEGDDDILIGGRTLHDENDLALLGILAEWNSNRSYSSRIAILRGTGSGPRLNGTIYLNVNTVFDDSDKDTLSGSGGQDWFWANTNKDKISGKSSNETIN